MAQGKFKVKSKVPAQKQKQKGKAFTRRSSKLTKWGCAGVFGWLFGYVCIHIVFETSVFHRKWLISNETHHLPLKNLHFSTKTSIFPLKIFIFWRKLRFSHWNSPISYRNLPFSNENLHFFVSADAPIQQKKAAHCEQQKLKQIVSKNVNRNVESEMRKRATEGLINLSNAQKAVAKTHKAKESTSTATPSTSTTN